MESCPWIYARQAASTRWAEALQLPLQLAQELRLSPEHFALVRDANPDTVLEFAAEGHLIAVTPAGSETSARGYSLVALLGLTLGELVRGVVQQSIER